jgi:small subunit ribosomal protein S7
MAQQDMMQQPQTMEIWPAQLAELIGQQDMQPGLKFGMPELPLPRSDIMKKRYDPLIEHFTHMIMWDGKLSQAQKVRCLCDLWRRFLITMANRCQLIFLSYST